MSELVPAVVDANPFDALGQPWRFGVTADDRVFAVITDMAKPLGHRDAATAARMLDEDEKGYALVRTPGGDQRVLVAYEDGIWELIFRSGSPEAKALKKRVKEILAEIRRTGSYSLAVEPQRELSNRDLALMVIAEADRADAERAGRELAEARIVELAPKAAAADALAATTGDLKMAAVANMLGVGRNNLFKWLRGEEVLRDGNLPYSQYAHWFNVVATSYRTRTGDERITHTTYVRGEGAVAIHRFLAKRNYPVSRPSSAEIELAGQQRTLPSAGA